MLPAWSTPMVRLSTQLNPGATGDDFLGTPVPTINVNPPDSRSASLRPMMAPGPGLHRVGSPEPKLQTIAFVVWFTSIARLLNCSLIKRLPGELKPPLDA